jgi:hypothetical protein
VRLGVEAPHRSEQSPTAIFISKQQEGGICQRRWLEYSEAKPQLNTVVSYRSQAIEWHLQAPAAAIGSLYDCVSILYYCAYSVCFSSRDARGPARLRKSVDYASRMYDPDCSSCQAPDAVDSSCLRRTVSGVGSSSRTSLFVHRKSLACLSGPTSGGSGQRWTNQTIPDGCNIPELVLVLAVYNFSTYPARVSKRSYEAMQSRLEAMVIMWSVGLTDRLAESKSD